MSAIAAFFAREAPLDPSAIADLIRSMHERGPDSSATWQSGRIALGHAAFVVTPGDEQPQPVVHAASGCAIVFDGRIDARTELGARCDLDRREVDGMSDATLLLHAFLARGLDIFPHVLGDFAFALWDAPRDRLICGRDVLGWRPLFYTASDRDLVVASELQAVLRGRGARPNLGMVAEALACAPTSRDETLFEDVWRVPPGSLLVATGTSLGCTRFIRLEAAPPARRSADAHREEFREILTRAVGDRLRARGRIGVMLSGGLDSTAVYAAARGVGDVDAYTVAHPDPALDESALAQAVVARNGGRFHRAHIAASGYDYLAEIERYRDLPTCPSGANSSGLRRLAASHGVRVLLNGIGGDECFLGHSNRWADWLRSGQWLLLWRELRTWNASADPTPWFDLLRIAVRPLVPAPALRAVAHLRRPGHHYPWIPPSFLRQTQFAERVRRVPDERGPSHAATGMIHSLVEGGAVAAWEEQERLAARFHQDDRSPLLDRRVIAFALRLPEHVRATPGSPKDFLRRAWSDRLPLALINPLAARDHSIHAVEALEAAGGAARFADLALAELGCVDSAAVRRMAAQLFATARTSRQHVGYIAPLWAVFAVDAWYRGALDWCSWPRIPNRRSQGASSHLAGVSTAGRR